MSEGQERDRAGAVGGRARQADLAGGLVLLGALLWTFRSLLGEDWSAVIRLLVHDHQPPGGEPSFVVLVDTRFVVWLVSRNARTWLESPTELFAGEICHPTSNSLALGEPALSLGLLGIPAWLFSGDPIATFNWTSLVVVAIGAAAMYALVRVLTQSPTAATAAALLYGFHPLKITDPIHIYVPDTAWTVLAILFFLLWVRTGHWRHALLAGGSVCLQIGGSLYPLLAGVAFGIPIVIWAIWQEGLAKTRLAQWSVVAAMVGGAALFVYSPFLGKSFAGALSERGVQIYLPWSQAFGPGPRGLGWGLLFLAALAFLPGSKGVLPSHEGVARPPIRDGHVALSRWPLLMGVVLCLLLATGGNEVARAIAGQSGETPPPALPNLFQGLSLLLPGLDAVRLPAAIGHGAVLGLSALAGCGIAHGIGRIPERFAKPAGVAIVLLVALATLRPGLPGGVSFEPYALRPEAPTLDFLRAVDRSAPEGAWLEIPNPKRPHPRYGTSILWSAYHGRRTSSCYNSFLPPETVGLEALAEVLPEAEALDAVRDQGFGVVIVHRGLPRSDPDGWLRRFETAAQRRPDLRLLHRNESLAAFAIERAGTAPDEAPPPSEQPSQPADSGS